MLWALDRDGVITLSTGRGLRKLGFEPGELVGRSVFELYPESHESYKYNLRALAGEAFTTVVAEGELWFETHYTPLFDDSGEPAGTIAVSNDITERKRAEQKVAFLAYHDELTGLPKRTLFEEHVSLAIARAGRRDLAVALLYLDLDRFKLINDSFGHAAGDDLLCRITQRLRDTVRQEDLVARHSGDEFLVLLADLRIRSDVTSNGQQVAGAVQTSKLVAEKIHDSLRKTTKIEGHDVSGDASIGISLYPRDAQDADTMLQHADIAMYESKRSRRGGTEVYGGTAQDPTTQLSIAGRLRDALERGELSLHYQPIVKLADGTVPAVEALLRWRQPNGDLMLPGEFMPVAEEIGMLEAIDDWVVDAASRRWARWNKDGTTLALALNISSLRFRSPGLADKLLAQIRGAGGDPRWVGIEITESTVMADPDLAKATIVKLREADMSVAIDDFGSGYSSLSRLADLPVHTLKMDGSFIHNIPDDQGASVMVAGIIEIGKRMGVYSLAECIETEAQREFLAGCGCFFGQGYLFSEAVAGEQIPELVSGNPFA